MNIFELVNKRESCRNYTDKIVSSELLRKCIETARLAPSACNGQPWHFYAITNEETVKKIRPCIHTGGMNGFVEKSPAFIVIVEEKTTLTAKVGGKLKGQEFSQTDIGIATAHLCFAASEQGLSTCILGWFDEKKIKDCLDISSAKRVRLAMAVGYADDTPLREKKRKPLDEIATFI